MPFLFLYEKKIALLLKSLGIPIDVSIKKLTPTRAYQKSVCCLKATMYLNGSKTARFSLYGCVVKTGGKQQILQNV